MQSGEFEDAKREPDHFKCKGWAEANFLINDNDLNIVGKNRNTLLINDRLRAVTRNQPYIIKAHQIFFTTDSWFTGLRKTNMRTNKYGLAGKTSVTALISGIKPEGRKWVINFRSLCFLGNPERQLSTGLARLQEYC